MNIRDEIAKLVANEVEPVDEILALCKKRAIEAVEADYNPDIDYPAHHFRAIKAIDKAFSGEEDET